MLWLPERDRQIRQDLATSGIGEQNMGYMSGQHRGGESFAVLL